MNIVKMDGNLFAVRTGTRFNQQVTTRCGHPLAVDDEFSVLMSLCASDDQQINYRFLFIDETNFQRHGQNLTRCYYQNFFSFFFIFDWFGKQDEQYNFV